MTKSVVFSEIEAGNDWICWLGKCFYVLVTSLEGDSGSSTFRMLLIGTIEEYEIGIDEFSKLLVMFKRGIMSAFSYLLVLLLNLLLIFFKRVSNEYGFYVRKERFPMKEGFYIWLNDTWFVFILFKIFLLFNFSDITQIMLTSELIQKRWLFFFTKSEVPNYLFPLLLHYYFFIKIKINLSFKRTLILSYNK